MKKKIILILIIIIAIIFIIGYVFYNRAKTIEEITKVSLDDIAYIEIDRGGIINLTLEDFLKEYKEAKFKICTEFHNSTVAEYSIIAYDESGQVLLTLRIGNDYKIVAGEYDANNPPKRYKKVN